MRRLLQMFSGSHRFAEFLPDAEGVVERHHSPIAGLLILTVALAFASALAWAALAEVEQVVRASGQVEPAGRVKIINHADGGRIAQIHVEDGARVTTGAPLVTFDREVVETRLAELTGRWQAKSIEAMRLAAEVSDGDLVVERQLASDRPELVHQQAELLVVRQQAHASRVTTVDQTIERRRRELQSVEAELTRLHNSHGLLDQQMGSIRELAEKGYYPKLRLVTVERQLSDLLGDIKKSEARREAAAAALAEAGSRRAGLPEERRSELLSELAAANAERDRLAEAVKRHRATLRHLVVRAPADGIVQQLAVTSGQSVGSNQPLLKLVPTAGGLVIEARVANQDIGHLGVGQPARVKVLAYDFLRYGTLDGEIARIDADATLDPTTGELSYGVTVRTDVAQLASAKRHFEVLPGMAVELDVLVGERTILSYLTDRIFRLGDAAFREG